MAVLLFFKQPHTVEIRDYRWMCAYLVDDMRWQTPLGKLQQKAFQVVHFISQVGADAWEGQMWRTAYTESAHATTALQMHSFNFRSLNSQTTANAPTSLHSPGMQCPVISTGTVHLRVLVRHCKFLPEKYWTSGRCVRCFPSLLYVFHGRV